MSTQSTDRESENQDGQSQEGSGDHLSMKDVERLMEDRSADSRINVLEKIASQYTDGGFKDREYIFAEQIFRLMMKDAEVKVRQTLAHQLKDNADIPRDIVLHLAKDVEEVSLPVLHASDVLSEADLIQIVETSREISKLLAISDRDTVTERVSEALVDSKSEEVVKTLLKNEGARISENAYSQILSDFSGKEEITSAMVQRAQMPISIVEKLVEHVSASMAQDLQKRYKIEDKKLDQVRETITLDLMNFPQNEELVEQTVMQMISGNRLSPSIILSSICRGYLAFYEVSLAKLAGIPKSNARKLIHDKGPLGFRALYSKTQLPESMFDAVRLVLRVVKEMDEDDLVPGSSEYANELVGRILKMAEGQQVDNLPYVIALIRQAASD